MIIKYNGVDVSNRLTSYKRACDFTEYRLIGNVPTYQLDISLNNKDGYFDSLNTSFYWSIKEYDISVELFFLVVEAPEKYTNELSLKMFSDAYNLDVAYNSQLAYPTTIKEQLEEIKALTGFTFVTSAIPTFILNNKVAWYDNTLSIRTHLGWIAELAGTNLIPNGKGSFIFKSLSKTPIIATDQFASYEKDAIYQVTRVMYDDSLNVFSKGNTTGNTLFIDSGNLYVDNQDIIDYVYDLYVGLQLNIVTGIKMVLPSNVGLGDMISYNNEFNFIVTSLNASYTGGDLLIADVEGSIYTKNEEKQIQKISNDTKIKKIQVKMDQEEQRLDIVAEKAENAEEQTSKLTISIDEISTSINSLSESVYKFETGSHNIFSNCNQGIEAVDNEIYSNDMPLDIAKDYLQAKDICISVQIDFVNAIIGSGYAGATFDVGYKDGTKKTYSCFLYAGEQLLEYVIEYGITNTSKRFYTTYKIEDKEITSVSNLKIIITAKGEKITVSRPKVEFGTYPTGFDYDLQFIRDNINTIHNQYSVIEQDIESITLSVGDVTKSVETIKGELSVEFTTELKSAITMSATEIKSEVSQTYATKDALTDKVDSKTIISTINQSAEAITIDANKISLKGKEIDLTSDNVVINSDNFKVDKYGNVVMNNATLTDGLIDMTESGSRGVIQLRHNTGIYQTRYAASGLLIKDSSNRTLVEIGAEKADQYYRGELWMYDPNTDASTGIYSGRITTKEVKLEEGFAVTGANVHKLRMVTTTPYLEVTMTTGAVYGVNMWISDKRLKKNAKSIKEKALDKIDQFQIKEFDYIDNDNHTKWGLFADDLEQIESEFIFEVGEDKIKQPKESTLIPYMIKCIQELNNKISEIGG